MVALRAPFGFKPSRNLVGPFDPSTRRFPLQTSGTYARHPVFIGSPVVFVTAAVGVMQMSTVGSAAEPNVAGIVMQVLDSNQKPLTHSQPTRGPFVLSSAAGFVDIYTNPLNLYWVATDVTANGTHINACVGVTALSSANANNRSGRSPFGLTLGTDTSATVSRPFRVIGPSAIQRDYLDLGNDQWVEGVEVVIAMGIHQNSSV